MRTLLRLMLVTSCSVFTVALPEAAHAQVCEEHRFRVVVGNGSPCTSGGGTCGKVSLLRDISDCDGNYESTCEVSCSVFVEDLDPGESCGGCQPICVPNCPPGSIPEASCGFDACSYTEREVCNGMDDDGDGQVDEEVCEPEGPCQNYRTDPVHVGSGAYLTHPQVDVRYAGVDDIPIQFVRRYTSMDRWPAQERTRLSSGWFHTFDEHLYSKDLRAPGTPVNNTAPLAITHRTATATSRRFDCGTSHSPLVNFSCLSNDGSLDTLKWNAAQTRWEVWSSLEVVTRFNSSGDLLGRFNTRGIGYSVVYNTSGTFNGRIAYAIDHLGRRLNFNWSQINGEVVRLASLQDNASGSILATFTHDASGSRLSGAASAAGTEEYDYASNPMPANNAYFFMTLVKRDGLNSVSVSYVTDGSGAIPQGRVRTVSAGDGSYSMRWPGESNNSCANSNRTTQIVDRSTAPIGGISCAVDADCSAGGATTVCDAGVCRASTCQEFAITGTTVNTAEVTALTGNCSCGGAQNFTWMSPGTGSPRRISNTLDRNGRRTTYAYDTSGRVVASCVGDNDGSVTTTPSSCPSTGVWTATQYHTRWKLLPTLETRRSQLSSGGTTTIAYTYDTNHPELLSATQTGYTRTLANATVQESVSASFVYDGQGRVLTETGPAGETTTRTYYSSGAYQNGMPQTTTHVVGADTLVTTYSNYSALGAPGTIVRPWGTSEAYQFSFGGMRLTSQTIGTLPATTFSYTTAGRLEEVVDPTGRRIRFSYDSLGRIVQQDTRDSAGAVASDRVQYTYDAAGRSISVSQRRVSSAGVPQAVEREYIAAYQAQGFQSLETSTPFGASSLSYDTALMGYLEGITRADGNQLSASHDIFGRQTSITRYFGGASSSAFTMGYSPPSAVNAGDSRPTLVTDAAGKTRQYTYDDFGQLVRSVGSDYGTFQWRYVNGRLTESTNAQSKRSVYTYDALSRLVGVDNDANNPTFVGQDYHFIYQNSAGGVACGTSNPCTNRRGRLAKVEMEAYPGVFWTLEYAYAQDGKIKSELWPNGHETKYEYDSLGRLIRTRMPIPSGDMIRYDYDTVAGNALDPTEAVTVAAELTAGTNYFLYARNINYDSAHQMTSVRHGDNPTTWNSATFGYNLAGAPTTWQTNRNVSGVSTKVVDRAYTYEADGARSAFTSTTETPRRFFYDGANRVTCVVNNPALTSCPTPPNAAIIQTYAYDTNDNRTSLLDSAGTTTYASSGNALTTESVPGSRTVNYTWTLSGPKGMRASDNETTAGYPNNQRNYLYDGVGRVRVINLPRTGATVGAYDSHQIVVLYDHLSRPIYMADLNLTNSKERRENLYWDFGNRLINRRITPDSTQSTNYSVDVYAHISRADIGQIHLDYVGGTFTNETRHYIATDPVGLPIATYQWTSAGSTSVSWSATYAAYGGAHSTSGSGAPPFGFRGQYVIEGSQAERWNGATVQTLRLPLRANRWRTYDPRIGQYLSADSTTVRGGGSGYRGGTARNARSLSHSFAYADLDPVNSVDPNGRWPLPAHPNVNNLPGGWAVDTVHQHEGGLAFRDPSGNRLTFHYGREINPETGRPWGRRSHQNRDHYHLSLANNGGNGGRDWYPVGADINIPPASECSALPEGNWTPWPDDWEPEPYVPMSEYDDDDGNDWDALPGADAPYFLLPLILEGPPSPALLLELLEIFEGAGGGAGLGYA
ncbi:MAG: RHS repeat protein [Sandaracinaceae bacterium]|nr:RHS repeat protein [Sandaracinaceae bacterium]